MGIEPTSTPWKGVILPVNYTRFMSNLFFQIGDLARAYETSFQCLCQLNL